MSEQRSGPDAPAEDAGDRSPAREPVRFSLDGVAYTVDLSRAQAHSLRAVLAPFIAAARPTSADPS